MLINILLVLILLGVFFVFYRKEIEKIVDENYRIQLRMSNNYCREVIALKTKINKLNKELKRLEKRDI